MSVNFRVYTALTVRHQTLPHCLHYSTHLAHPGLQRIWLQASRTSQEAEEEEDRHTKIWIDFILYGLANPLARDQKSANFSLTNSSSVARPNSFSSLFGDYSNPLGAPGAPAPIGNMTIGTSNLVTSQPHTPVSTPTAGQQTQQQQSQKNPKLYKTELCRSWMDHGRCNYGERCQYAHGESEKRPVPRHPKYKTEACQSFHQTGYCPYGPRCHFIHNENTDRSAFSQPTTPAGNNGLSPYASQYHNTSLKQQQQQQQQHQQHQQTHQNSALGVPSNILQRVYSLPGGYGSAGESPAGSSNDSGSESPNGSFSPGLDLDDPSPFSTGFLPTIPHKHSSKRPQTNRFLSYDQPGFNDAQFSHLLNDICSWNLDDNAFTTSSLNSSKWSTDDVVLPSATTSSATTPGRLPVFAQLSNPQ
ncbi:unnamed protein product [Caenorhabditis bovis]|uniref:C3H1-type domain-containing protein n=1 Tax=Caenorhabditis bovis TaxID=2654633 RepID=A0A8S1EE69_9PELO|nr:unnamed protein product [Caenorhabditis bovis]